MAWVYASHHTHGVTHLRWNPLRPLAIRSNTHGEIHTVATKETVHAAIDIFLLTRCSLQKWLKAINHGEWLYKTSSFSLPGSVSHTASTPPPPQSSLEALSDLQLFLGPPVVYYFYILLFS